MRWISDSWIFRQLIRRVAWYKPWWVIRLNESDARNYCREWKLNKLLTMWHLVDEDWENFNIFYSRQLHWVKFCWHVKCVLWEKFTKLIPDTWTRKFDEGLSGILARVDFVNLKQSCVDSTFNNWRKSIFIYDEYRLLKSIINISTWSFIWKSSHRTDNWYKREENSIFRMFFSDYSSSRNIS